MSKPSKITKKTVELQPAARPSRIRREPVVDKPNSLVSRINWSSREWEIRLGVAGMILFALAIWAITIGVSNVTAN